MRTKGLFLAAFVAFLFMGTQSALAQTRTADMNLTVTANNVGIFTCTLDVTTFDFGDVDADGNTTTLGVIGARLGSDDGAEYNAAGVSNWTCRAAPSSSVDFTIESTDANHTGSLAPDRLEVQMTEGVVPGGFATFTSNATMLSNVAVGNGAGGQATGAVDLRLTVMDTDATGANTWNVVLRATGTP